MKWTKTEKRQLAIFFAVAFGAPCLMGVAMALVHSMGGSTAVFANAQMFYPAAGAMLALLVTRRGDKLLPRRFYFGFLALTAVMAAVSMATFMQPETALLLANLVIILGSLVCLVLHFLDGRARRTAGGEGAVASWSQTAPCGTRGAGFAPSAPLAPGESPGRENRAAHRRAGSGARSAIGRSL